MRALVVDDDAINREILRRMLARLGLAVDEASDGLEALALAGEAASAGPAYDFIFMDISMPGLDGYETARRLRASGLTARVFAVSGRDSGLESLKAGFDAFLQKPLTLEILREAMDASNPPRPR
jgi:CheY-like chemotaxis protein